MKKTKLSLAILVAMSAATTTSFVEASDVKGYVDFRHQYSEGTGKQADRFKVMLQKGSFITELVANTEQSDSKFLKDQRLSNYDIGVFYAHQVSKNLVIVPGFDYILHDDMIEYIPALRANYKMDNGVRLQTRYKQIFNDKNDNEIGRLDFWLGYNYNSTWDFNYQVSFGKVVQGDQILYNGDEDKDYWQNLTVRYDGFGAFKPYFELGDIKESKDTDNRQLRYRVGLRYAF